MGCLLPESSPIQHHSPAHYDDGTRKSKHRGEAFQALRSARRLLLEGGRNRTCIVRTCPVTSAQPIYSLRRLLISFYHGFTAPSTSFSSCLVQSLLFSLTRPTSSLIAPRFSPPEVFKRLPCLADTAESQLTFFVLCRFMYPLR